MAEQFQLKSIDGAIVEARVVTSASSSGSDIGQPHSPTTTINHDDIALAKAGKKPVLKRNFGFMSMLGFACTIMITWEGMLCVFVYGLEDGGPAGLIYGFLFCWFGYFTVVASMAELASMTPTAAGQYHWVYQLAPPEWKNFFSYITGFQSTLAWQACLASASYLGGQIIQGLLILNYPDSYVSELYQGTLLLWAVVFLAVCFNTWLAKQLPKVEASILILHIFGFFAILITLTYLAPTKSTPEEVFAQFLTLGGYNKGLSFFVGLITTVFAFIGADGAVHMSEEIVDATRVVPQTLIWSIAVNGLLGFGMLVAILFCIGDIDTALTTPTAFPFIEIFQQATSSNTGATIMVSLVLTLMICAAIASLAAASRQMWAFARDNGLPGSKWLSKVEPRSKLPLYAIGVSATITLLLGLINIGSPVAFNAVASLLVAGFLGSYILPISLILYRRIKTPAQVEFGPFSLGRLGPFFNIFALAWIFLVMFFSFWPTSIEPAVTPKTMNWSCLLWGATMLFGVFFYMFRQRHIFHGPIIEISVVEHFA